MNDVLLYFSVSFFDNDSVRFLTREIEGMIADRKKNKHVRINMNLLDKDFNPIKTFIVVKSSRNYVIRIFGINFKNLDHNYSMNFVKDY